MQTKMGPLLPGVGPPQHGSPKADPDPLAQRAQRCLPPQGWALGHRPPYRLPAPWTALPGLVSKGLFEPLPSHHLTLSSVGQAHLGKSCSKHTHTHHTHQRQLYLVLSEVPFATHEVCPLPPGSFTHMSSPPAPSTQDVWLLSHHCPQYPQQGPPPARASPPAPACWVSGWLTTPSCRGS